MTKSRTTILLASTLAVLVLGSAVWPTHAQGPGAQNSSEKVTVAVALTKPFPLPFRKGISLEGLAEHLGKELGAPVVIDVAALERLKITQEETVRLHLDGVRLQTGLKLLLDQVGMTYRVVPEDNLLVFTDRTGATDPAERSLEELQSLRHDVADLRVVVEDIYELLAPREIVPSTRNPTIIEEIPDPKARPAEPATRSRPG